MERCKQWRHVRGRLRHLSFLASRKGLTFDGVKATLLKGRHDLLSFRLITYVDHGGITRAQRPVMVMIVRRFQLLPVAV